MKRESLRRCLKLALPLALALAVPVLFVCCTPGWLSNSKGFVFVTLSGQMLHLDVASGETKKIVHVGFPAVQPAIFPDGRVAVPMRNDDGDAQLKIFNLKGVELAASPKLEGVDLLAAGGPRTEHPMIYNYAAIDGSHVVTFIPGNQKAFVYDVKANKVRTIDKVVAPINFMGNPVPLADVSPITPDGRGFLAIDTSEDKQSRNVVFHPWSADDAPVKIKNEYDFEALQKKVQPEKGGVATLPSWQGGMLRGRLSEGVLELDLMAKSIIYREDMKSQALLQYAEREGVFVVMELADDTLLQITKKQKLQITKRRGEPVDLVDFDGDTIAGVFPSPDRRLLVIRSLTAKGGVKVFNTKGEVVAKYQETR